MSRIVRRGGPGPDFLGSPNDLSGDRYFLAGLGGNDELSGLGSGNDTLVGGAGSDTLVAGRGSDSLIGNAGADQLIVSATNSDELDYASGGIGADKLSLTLGLGDANPGDRERSFDTLVGGGGRDLLVLRGSSTEFRFTPRDFKGWHIDIEMRRIFDPVLGYDVAEIKGIEEIVGTRFDDTLRGWIGDELLYGSFGNDLIEGGDGNDTLIGPSGQDVLRGGDGEDFLIGGYDVNPRETFSFPTSDFLSVDTLSGGKKSDVLVALGPSILHGGSGNDTLRIWAFSSGGKTAELHGGIGNDTLAFGAFDQNGKPFGSFGRQQDTGIDGVLFDGGSGIDTADFSVVFNGDGILQLKINLAEDIAMTSFLERSVTLTGIENVVGTESRDLIEGDNFSNVLEGGSGNDTLRGFGGRDVIAGNGDDDSIEGGARDDTLQGGDGVDEIKGQGGDDDIRGGGKGDFLFGGQGNDTIMGGPGNDIIDLGAGKRGDRQVADGGIGEDTFVLRRDIGEVMIDGFDAKGRLHDFFDLRMLPGITSGDLDVIPYEDGTGVRLFLAGTRLTIDLPGVLARHLDAGDFIV